MPVLIPLGRSEQTSASCGFGFTAHTLDLLIPLGGLNRRARAVGLVSLLTLKQPVLIPLGRSAQTSASCGFGFTAHTLTDFQQVVVQASPGAAS
jgi:hypothetical protein